MRKSALVLLLLMNSCFPDMHKGPKPHSIEFNATKFSGILEYFILNEDEGNFKIENPPAHLPTELIEAMEEIGILEFRNVGEYKMLFGGYGVVGKGWGFIYGGFTNEEVNDPSTIKGKAIHLDLTFLEHLEGKWYRFAVN